jgi:CRISPR type III-B/RAMP module RAMP protein Cmr6
VKYILPGKTAIIIDKSQQCNNLRLLLDKYPPAEVIDKDEAIDKKKDTKGAWLRSILTNHINNTELAMAAYHRWYSYTSALKALHFSEEIDWRMVVGLGGDTILETDLTLQHLYGIPFIPGSALKGLTQAYAITEDKDLYIEGSKGNRIFGTQDQAGTVLFFDAIPKDGQATFVLDIMNPHYPRYYQKGEPPTNDQNPVPIPFLTVANTSFMFALALRNSSKKEYKDDVSTAYKWLRLALEKYGVGGKTSAGYGYFKNFESQPRLPEDAYVSKEDVPQTSEPYIRPTIPVFREGQKITGVVIDPKKDQEVFKRLESGEAIACLKYKDREFLTKKLLILIPPEYSEAKNWSAGNMKNCFFVREEAQGNCTVLICRP